MAIDAGAAALGLVSKMPSGPGVIPEEVIAHIAARVPPGVATFLLTSELDVRAIIGQQKRTGVNTLQIVDRLESGAHQELRAALPGIALVQVIHVRGPGFNRRSPRRRATRGCAVARFRQPRAYP